MQKSDERRPHLLPRYYLTFAFLVLLLVTFLQINSWAMSSLDESPSGRYPEGKLPCFLPEVRTFYDIVKYDYIGFHFLSDASWPSWAAQLQRQLTGITPQNSDSKDKIYNQIEKICDAKSLSDDACDALRTRNSSKQYSTKTN